jgi:hypothetical protein
VNAGAIFSAVCSVMVRWSVEVLWRILNISTCVIDAVLALSEQSNSKLAGSGREVVVSGHS